jgi:drug/metabolite transporter (DMT)-like permease
MDQRPQPALALGLATALLWGPHYLVVQGLAQAGAPGLILSLHLLFWPALLSWALLLLSGRKGELAIFQRRETYFLILAVLGGYGFWVLRGLAFDAAAGADCRSVFYAAPLMMGLAGLFSRQKPPGKAILGLILGLAGCYVIARWGMRGAGTVHVFSKAGLLGLSAAACWAGFSLMAPQVLGEARPLPVIALVTGIGTACILITAVSMGESPFDISWAQARSCAVTGALTVGLMMSFWLGCLGAAQPQRAGALWYLAMVTGALWSVLRGGELSWWPFLGGAILIAFALYCTAGGSRRRESATIGDVIRGSV